MVGCHSLLSLFTTWLPWGKQCCSACIPAIVCCLSTGPKPTGPQTMDWNLQTVSQNSRFSFIIFDYLKYFGFFSSFWERISLCCSGGIKMVGLSNPPASKKLWWQVCTPVLGSKQCTDTHVSLWSDKLPVLVDWPIIKHAALRFCDTKEYSNYA
jgi:hypothetical protein